MKRKLGIFVRLLIWAQKTFTEQIIFIRSENHLKKVAAGMQQGKTNIYTKMERKILADLRDIRRKGNNNSNNMGSDDFKDMVRT